MVRLVSRRNWFYSIAYLIVRFLLQVIWRLEVHNEENVPLSGGVVISPTHKSYFDPPVIGAALPREAHYMAKKELFRVPLLKNVIKKLNAFPVDRVGFSRDAIKKSIELLERGDAVVIFPEGHRQKGDIVVGECKPGVGVICLHSKAPVLPVLIVNSQQWTRLKKIEVWFGDLIRLDFDKGDNNFNYRMMSELIKERIEELWRKRESCKRRYQQ